MIYAVHGECSGFRSSSGQLGRSTHGFQKPCKGRVPTDPQSHESCVQNASDVDVINMSCTQGWTCGNLVSRPADIAEFFWQLLGPQRQTYGLVNDASYKAPKHLCHSTKANPFSLR